MHQTLLFIPEQVAGIPVFGVGLLLAVWAVVSLGVVGWSAYRHGWRSGETGQYVVLLGLLGGVIWQVMPRIVIPGLGLPIRSYGVMLLVAILAGTGLSVWRGRRRGWNSETIATLCFWGVVCGIVGARAFYVIEYWSDFQRPTLAQTVGAILNITQGGIVVYGALLGGLAGFGAYAWKQRMPLLATFDLLAPGMLLGLAIGRVGCFLNGCCFGGACDLPWAVRFPAGSPPYLHQMEHGQLFLQGLQIAGEGDAPPVISAVEPGSPAAQAGLGPGQRITHINQRAVTTAAEARGLLATPWPAMPQPRAMVEVRVQGRPEPVRWQALPLPDRSLPVHPTQLYSSIDALVLCGFLLAYDRFRRKDGELLAVLLTVYPITRFLMEQIRTDEPKIWITHLSIGQVFSVLILCGAAGLWIYLYRPKKGTVA